MLSFTVDIITAKADFFTRVRDDVCMQVSDLNKVVTETSVTIENLEKQNREMKAEILDVKFVTS